MSEAPGVNTALRWLAVLLGVNLVAAGVALFLAGGLGSDPLTVLQQGMHRVLGVTVGQASLIYNGVILLLAALLARRGLGLGTVVYILLVGVLIDGYQLLLPEGGLPGGLPVAVLCLAAGQLFISFGFALIIHLGLGNNGLDALLLALERKTRAPYWVCKTTADVLYTGLGALMGGVAGVGTVLVMLSSGYLVSLFRHRLDKRKEE